MHKKTYTLHALLAKSPLPHKMQKNNVFFHGRRGHAHEIVLFKRYFILMPE